MNGPFEETAQQRLARYRALATRARETAEKAGSEDLRAGYLGLARSWDDLAAQLLSEEGLSASSVPPAQQSFSLFDQPRCENCGTDTTLVRRTPHPSLGLNYELQTFACPKCEHSQTRDVEWSAGVSRP
jgi:hypothetical protein